MNEEKLNEHMHDLADATLHEKKNISHRLKHSHMIN